MKLPQGLRAVPPSARARAEIACALDELAAQCRDDWLRRRAECAALRHELEQIALSVQELRREYDPWLRSYVLKYSPDQPRVPAGNSAGGQWTSEDTNSRSDELADMADERADEISENNQLRVAAPNDASVMSDAITESAWNPNARYAENDENDNAANENLTPEQICRQAYSDGVASARINPSLDPTDYLAVRYQLTSALELCLNLANGARPIARDGDFIWFSGAGVVIFRPGLSPLFVRSP